MRTLNLFFGVNNKRITAGNTAKKKSGAGSFFSKLLQNIRNSRLGVNSGVLSNRSLRMKPRTIRLNLPKTKTNTPAQAHAAVKTKISESEAGQHNASLPVQTTAALLQQVLHILKNKLPDAPPGQVHTISLDNQNSLSLEVTDKQVHLTFKAQNARQLQVLQNMMPQLKSAFKDAYFAGKKIQLNVQPAENASQAKLDQSREQTPMVTGDPVQNEQGIAGSNKKRTQIPTQRTEMVPAPNKNKEQQQVKEIQIPKGTARQSITAQNKMQQAQSTKEVHAKKTPGSPPIMESKEANAQKADAAASVDRGKGIQPETNKTISGASQMTKPASESASAVSGRHVDSQATSGRSHGLMPQVQGRPANSATAEASAPRGEASSTSAVNLHENHEIRTGVLPHRGDAEQAQSQPSRKGNSKEDVAADKGSGKLVQRLMKKALWQRETTSSSRTHTKKMRPFISKNSTAEPTGQEQKGVKEQDSAKTENAPSPKQAVSRAHPVKQSKTTNSAEKIVRHSQAAVPTTGMEDQSMQVKGKQLTARLEQILQQFEQFKPQDKERTVFKLSASPVGELEIHLKQQKSGRQISLLVESDKMKAEVQKILPHIEQSLAAKGLSFSALSVDVGSFGQAAEQSAQGAKQRQHHKSTKGKEARYEPDSPTVNVRRYGYNTIEIVA